MILIGRGLDLNAGPGEGSKGKASESEQTGSNRNRKMRSIERSVRESFDVQLSGRSKGASPTE